MLDESKGNCQNGGVVSVCLCRFARRMKYLGGDVEEIVGRKQAELSVMEVAGAGLDIVRSSLGKYIKTSVVPVVLFAMCIVLFILRDYIGYFILGGFLLLIVGGWYYVRFRVRCYRHMLLDEQPGQLDPKVERNMVWDYIGNSILINVYVGVVSVLLAFVPLALGYGLHEQLGPEGKRILTGIFNGSMIGRVVPLLGMAFLADKVTLVFADVSVGGPAAYARLEKYAKHARWKIILIMALIWGTSIVVDCAGDIAGAFKVEMSDWIKAAYWVGGVLVGFATMLWSMGAEAVLYKRLVMDVEAAEADVAAQGTQAPVDVSVEPGAATPAGL